MDPERIDLSALDPSRDELRWERLVHGVTTRTKRRLGLREGLLSVSRPALAVAAAVAALSWVPSILARGAPSDTEESRESDVMVLEDLAVRGAASTAADWYLSREGVADVRE
jgi:hypothetical protein